MKVLVADDDKLTREGLAEILEDEGYEVIQAANGSIAVSMFKDENPDFICLDIMMPECNGYDACKQIREKCAVTPIIFLSAKSEEVDKVIGLNLGADDYIVKPFGIDEVVARIRAVTRRCIQNEKDVNTSFSMLDLMVSPESLTVKRGEELKEINLLDLKILRFLYSNKNRVLSRDQIFKECWNINSCGNTRALDQKISQLRKIVEVDSQNPKIIKTVHGAGYAFQEV
ncbi:MAG: response regulator transcription factor [Lentisphaeraceae bacterium]|nr:response regulator transcription factor [Lentisphaeraceae bacterium]